MSLFIRDNITDYNDRLIIDLKSHGTDHSKDIHGMKYTSKDLT